MSYLYDIDGIRTAKNDDGITTNYVVDKNRDYAQVLNELDATNTPTVSYVYGDDLIKQSRAANDSYYLYDGLGSTRALTDDTGSITDTYDYSAYGAEIGSAGITENSYRYTGEQFDSNLNQIYLRARYYDPSIGRFTQQDTWMGNNSDPVTLHKYAYANLDPANGYDPTGFFFAGDFLAAQNIQSQLQAQATVNLIGIGIVLSGANSLADLEVEPQRAATRLSLGLAKFKVRQCQRSGTQTCNAGIPILIHGSDLGGLSSHIYEALSTGKSPILSKRASRHSDGWRASAPECQGRSRANQCDEYPFGISDQGGRDNYLAGRVSLKLINGGDNSRGGNRLRNFFRECGVTHNNQYKKWFGVLSVPDLPVTKSICARD